MYLPSWPTDLGISWNFCLPVGKAQQSGMTHFPCVADEASFRMIADQPCKNRAAHIRITGSWTISYEQQIHVFEILLGPTRPPCIVLETVSLLHANVCCFTKRYMSYYNEYHSYWMASSNNPSSQPLQGSLFFSPFLSFFFFLSFSLFPHPLLLPLFCSPFFHFSVIFLCLNEMRCFCRCACKTPVNLDSYWYVSSSKWFGSMPQFSAKSLFT